MKAAPSPASVFIATVMAVERWKRTILWRHILSMTEIGKLKRINSVLSNQLFLGARMKTHRKQVAKPQSAERSHIFFKIKKSVAKKMYR